MLQSIQYVAMISVGSPVSTHYLSNKCSNYYEHRQQDGYNQGKLPVDNVANDKSSYEGGESLQKQSGFISNASLNLLYVTKE